MNETLVLSNNYMHGSIGTAFLARKLEKAGIPVIFTHVNWPRDQFRFYPDGSFDYVQSGTCQHEVYNHFAYHGGSFLEGDNFILGSLTSNAPEKQANTHQKLKVEHGYYYDINPYIARLKSVRVSGTDDFYTDGPTHMDVIYNIGNQVRTIFTYNERELLRLAGEMSDKTGYGVVSLPIQEAEYAAVGFLEFGGKMIVDRRARETKKILKKLGYPVITTPFALKKPNRWKGSLHCMTATIPIEINDILKSPPKETSRFSSSGLYGFRTYDGSYIAFDREMYKTKISIKSPIVSA